MFLRSATSLASLLAADRLYANANRNDPPKSLLHAIKKSAGNSGHTLRVLHPEGCAANLAPVVQRFKQLTGIDVELIKGSLDDIASEIRVGQVLGASGKPVDIALPATYSIADLVAGDYIENLTDFAAQYEPAFFSEEMLYTLGDRYLGQLYGYQTDGDAYVMFYNQRLLDGSSRAEQYAQHHGKELKTPKTWQELDRQMAWMHQPSASVYGGSLYRNRRYVGWEFWSRLHGNGKYPVDDDFQPQLTTPESVAALQSLIDASESLEPSAKNNGLFDNFNSFAEGNKYCNIGWGGTQKYLTSGRSKVSNKLSFGLLPGGVDSQGNEFQTPYFNWGWNYVVLKKSQNSELAYLFTLFASLPQISTMAVRQREGFFDPHQSSHFDDDVIKNIYTDGFLTVQKDSLENCMPDFHVIGQERYQRILSEAVYAADKNLMSAEQALRHASIKWQKITDELGRVKQQQQWEFLKTLYPENLSRVLS